MFLIIVIALIVKYLRTLKKYLNELIYTSSKVSKGDFSIKLKNEYSGDLGRLSSNFNFMVSKIRDNIEELEDKNIKLKSILKSISSGIVALDNDERILLINDVAIKFFNNENQDLTGKTIDEAVKNRVLLNNIKKLIAFKNIKSIQVRDEQYEKIYNIKIDPILLKDSDNLLIGSIINIEDITENVKLEHIRSDFVANVTHELKTPLTSISGFVETLKYNEDLDIKMRTKFLDIIEEESNRLRNLIDDILMLSFIENEKSHEYESVNVYDIFIHIYELVNNLAKDKSISLNYEIKDTNIFVNTNKDYIKQILLNLIDNAIKYTLDGGSVLVNMEQDEKNVYISIKDSGIGIPKEDIPRIFERFYRVDKARSKKAGGTGLGLAIVKHIAINIGASINVESKLGEGSVFKVQMPK